MSSPLDEPIDLAALFHRVHVPETIRAPGSVCIPMQDLLLCASEIARLRAEIARVYKAPIYENGRMADGVSLKLIAAISEAAHAAGVSVRQGAGPPPQRPHAVRYMRPSGDTREEMRASVIASPLYPLGDAILVWVNEGDLANLWAHGMYPDDYTP